MTDFKHNYVLHSYHGSHIIFKRIGDNGFRWLAVNPTTRGRVGADTLKELKIILDTMDSLVFHTRRY